ncbi:MAG: site-specific integrase [candidate division Zixibacteria bacterium]|nr:site-specific integrase [candidate division Zixibacteria bacterium]
MQSTTLIHDKGKIDIHKRKEKYERALSLLENNSIIISQNKELILRFIRDCTLGKTIIGKSKKKIGPARCLKYLSILQRLSRLFGRSFNDVSQNDMECLIEKLESDRIKTVNGKLYAEATKCDIKKTIKKFWKWKDGNNKVYPELVEWIDTFIEIKDVPALTRSEIECMIDHTPNPRNKALLMVLFDSGARVEELLNVRLKKEHIFWKENIKCYMIRLEYSKTKPRTISVPLSEHYLRNWLKQHPVSDNPQAQLFPLTYPNLKMIIRRIGQRALGKKVTPHMLRHSSATYYANRLKNHYKLCYRYGWTMASDMVNRYLDREGIIEEETAEVVKADEIMGAKRKNQALHEELTLLKESYSELSCRFEKSKRSETGLNMGDEFMKSLMIVARQQQKMSRVLGELTGKSFDIVLPEAINKSVK